MATKPHPALAQPQLLQKVQTLLNERRWTQAAELLQQALGQRPRDAGLWLTLARTLRQAGDFSACLRAAQQAQDLAAGVSEELRLQAAHLAAQAATVLDDFGSVLRHAEQVPEGARSLDLLKQLGAAHNRLGAPQAAVAPLMQALTLKIDDRDAYMELGFAFHSLKMHEEAAECFRTLSVLYPEHLGAQAYLIQLEQHAARWEGWEQRLQTMLDTQHQAWERGESAFSVPFTLVGQPHHPQQMLEATQLTARHVCRAIKPLPPAPAHKPGARLHIAYLSNDFQAHATATLLTEVLEHHDRSRFEISLLSHSPADGSALRERLIKACDRFEEIGHLDLPGTAHRVRELGVDILIDLKGHTAGSRLAALAYRAAPLQVSWLGFPGTTGMPEVDYLIGDPIVTPLEHAPFYSECIAQMPHCYQPNDRQRERPLPPSRSELGLPEQALVLLSANQIYKLNAPLFDAWSQILKALPEAVIWQLSGAEQAQERLHAEMAARGVAPERLIFMPKLPLGPHLRRLAAADLALDSWPCNGHTTSSDALWAAVPVLTLQGEPFAGRVCASLLHSVGMPELICTDTQSYIHRVCELGRDPAQRAALRERLVKARDESALFDAPRFARDLEQLLLRMWQRHADGLPPAALPAQH